MRRAEGPKSYRLRSTRLKYGTRDVGTGCHLRVGPPFGIRKINEVTKMIARNSLLSLFAVALLSPLAIAAQAQNETLANRQPHYFDVNDWDIAPDSIN